ncbi:MAG TPA: hypothetical protein VFQ92_19295 [Blastocatellia bacterium]|nr:hypothetical protein [Blastocatellia bacterium]
MIRKLLAAAFIGSLVLSGTWLYAPQAQAQNVVVIEGTRKKLKLKKPNVVYLLRGGVFITKKLIVKPGVKVFGLPGSFLVIDRGAQIDAQGTRENPIVFTSAAPAGTKRRGDWGGLIFNGRAPVNVPGGEAEGEGDTGTYGGGANSNPNDNSGIMRFVRVEYGGFAISPDNELNCIAFQGVGAGTTVEFVQAAFGGDDGFEFFGGTVNAKNIVAVGASDDSIDWTEGWTGKIQFALVQQRADEADNGFECDNSAENHNLLPRSAPKMMNVTMVGAPGEGPGSTRGILLRVGTHGQFRNFIVTGFKNVGLEIRDDATFAGFNDGSLSLRGFIFFDNRGNNPNIAAGATLAAVQANGVKIQEIDPQLNDPFDTTAPDFRPSAGSAALEAGNVEPPFANDPFFVATNFIGAFDANDDWTLGWVSYVFGQ